MGDHRTDQIDDADDGLVEVRRDPDTCVGTLTFERGPSNFFTIGLLEQIASALEQFATTDTRAVVLQSSGRHFCAGMQFRPSGSLEHSGRHIYDDVVPRLFAQPIPLVAAVNGAAIGGGLGLAMSADFRVASSRARFAANFAKIGISHGFALSVTLPRVIGPQRASELLYTGRRVGGVEAHKLGMCDRLVEPEMVSAAAHTFAEELASSGPLAVESIRRSLRREMLADVQAALDEERHEQEVLRRTADFREGVEAYAARRNPKFTRS